MNSLTMQNILRHTKNNLEIFKELQGQKISYPTTSIPGQKTLPRSKRIIRAKENKNLQRFQKNTFLHTAAMYDSEGDVIQFLLQNGSNPLKTNFYNETAVELIKFTDTSVIKAFELYGGYSIFVYDSFDTHNSHNLNCLLNNKAAHLRQLVDQETGIEKVEEILIKLFAAINATKKALFTSDDKNNHSFLKETERGLILRYPTFKLVAYYFGKSSLRYAQTIVKNLLIKEAINESFKKNKDFLYKQNNKKRTIAHKDITFTYTAKEYNEQVRDAEHCYNLFDRHLTPEKLNLIVFFGPYINKKNAQGETALFLAIKRKKPDYTMYLKHNADPNIPDKNNEFPLEWAVKLNDKDLVITLLKHHAIVYPFIIQQAQKILAESQNIQSALMTQKQKNDMLNQRALIKSLLTKIHRQQKCYFCNKVNNLMLCTEKSQLTCSLCKNKEVYTTLLSLP